MRRPLEPGEEASSVVHDESELLARVHKLAAQRAAEPRADRGPTREDYEAEMVKLRDQIAEERVEDHPVLIEHMTRIAALAARAQSRALPVDLGSPYFAHMRLKTKERGLERESDVLIGKRGLIDRAAGVQIVDWRDAPVSQVYYRYDEGDDYEEELPSGTLRGEVLARRNVTIARSLLRRIGCPQGTFVSSVDGAWYALEGQGVALLEGGAGTASRPPRPQPVPRGQRRQQDTARGAHNADKALPEIAALVDRSQFELISEPGAGLVVIQGGAGSGKTTVALHRIAYLVFQQEERVRPSWCLFVVPSAALERYVAGVLPSLGVHGVPVTTYRAWARTLRKRLVPTAPDRYSDDTPPFVSRLKKHPGMLRLLEAVVQSELQAVEVELRANVDGAGDAAGAAIVMEAWQVRAKKAPYERVRSLGRAAKQGKLAITPQLALRVEQALRRASRKLGDPQRTLWELLTDRGRIAALADTSSSEQALPDPAQPAELDELVKWCSAQLDEELEPELEGTDEERLVPIDGKPLDDGDDSYARARLDEEDDSLLLRLYQLTRGELTRVDGEPLVYDHIAIDEAQDLSPVDVMVLVAATGEKRSVTIAGDTAQRIVFDNAFRGWEALIGDLGLSDKAGAALRLRPLELAYRSTAEVMSFARHVLGPLAPAEPPKAARHGAEVELHAFDGMGEAVAFVSEALRSLLGREHTASVAVISRHIGQADAWFTALQRAEVPSLRRVRKMDFLFTAGVDVTDVAQVKGLEFDYVILVDVNASGYPVTVESRHLLHIGATRATHQLWLIATGEPSQLVSYLAEESEAEGARTVERELAEAREERE
jgi:DNA helicase-2/ATP-dependent DNA helicase PcrA